MASLAINVASPGIICIHQYFFLAAYTMLLYDHFLTLPGKVGLSSMSSAPGSNLMPGV